VSQLSGTSLERGLRDAGFEGALLPEEPLAGHTTWRIGGPAELLARPRDRNDLVLAVQWASARGVPWRVLGNGSNLLVSDEGVRGLVLQIRGCLDETIHHGTLIAAGAGAYLPAVAELAASLSLEGLEFAAGIPATVGGALVTNARWQDREIGAVVESVDVMDEFGGVRSIEGADCGFGHRSSGLRGDREVVLGATFSLGEGDPAEVQKRLETHAAAREAEQPTELPSCGSVFLKPEGDFAGRLIAEAGLEGLRVGAIEVSPKHANFFVNRGGGTAAEVLELVERVEREVEDRFGVRLERGFELW
jgi:UDP-N-acetylmuramate dehydrogenase